MWASCSVFCLAPFLDLREKPCCSKVFTVELNTPGVRLDLKQFRQSITGSKPNLSALIPKSRVKLSGCTCSAGRVCHSSAVSVAREHNLCVPNDDYSQNYCGLEPLV